MTERLLQYIWQNQYYNSKELVVENGENLTVLHPGILNTHQGPDFSFARIKCGSTLLAGNIELHLKSSDWFRHKHDTDDNYQNVILHVVWEHDTAAYMPFPVLQLCNRVSNMLLNQYEQWMQDAGYVPCSRQVKQVEPLVMQAWKDRLLAERMFRKASLVESWLQETNFHWEESFWWLLARNFGAKVNTNAFELLARSLPSRILSKHKFQIHQLEALLFGQSGLLQRSFQEDYPVMLRSEYRFLQKKYKLKPNFHPLYFLRMRPVNFPTIRLAQLAMLIYQSGHLFSNIIEIDDLKQLKLLLKVTANDYWHYHFVFDELSEYQPKVLGDQMIDTLVINCICPILFAYGQYKDDDRFKSKALKWLEETAAEQNTVTRKFKSLGIAIKNGCDSQAVLELKAFYCDQRRCLDCAIGNSILKKATT
ncbi:MAG: DUF2851 family protein [Chitinophagaceae bacterium]|nr:DUF2851 family protein [Chitinophagaceae bacterium]